MSNFSDINNRVLVLQIEAALNDLKDRGLVRGFKINADGTFTVQPNFGAPHIVPDSEPESGAV